MTSSPIKLILTSGFAMFSMFFGSGNLIFPIMLGSQTQSSYIYAILGLLATGVLVPFLGLLGIIQFKGDRKTYFSLLGKYPAFALTALMLSLMGPFGILPRCILVSFGGAKSLYSSIPLWVFSFIFCAMIGALIWNSQRIVDIIGKFLTPFKLGSILFLVVVGLLSAPHVDASLSFSNESFLKGIEQGYQTMDLVAAFFFGATIYEYIRLRLPSTINASKIMLYGLFASLLGALLLSLIYIGFVMLGASYSAELKGVTGEMALPVVAHYAVGDISVAFIAGVLIISCLATATVLANLFADFLYEDVLKMKMSRPLCIIITVGIGFFMSLLGFEQICALLGNLLSWIYPFLLLYAAFQILRKFYLDFKGAAKETKTYHENA